MSQPIKCVVAGLSPDGDDGLFFVKIAVPDGFDVLDPDEIRHKQTAAAECLATGGAPIMVFDESSIAGKAMVALNADWEREIMTPLLPLHALDTTGTWAAKLASGAFEAALDETTATDMDTDLTAKLIEALNNKII